MNFKQKATNPQRIWKYHPFFCFCVFVFCNALLAYSGLSLDWKILIGLAGIVLPLVLAFVSPHDYSLTGKQIFQEDVFKPLSFWVWILLVGLSMFVRFYHLVTLPVWPMWDDSYSGFLSIKQIQNWSWRLSFTIEQAPPLFFWVEALFFKFAPPSQFTFWFFAAGLSVLVFLAGIWASRVFISSSLAFLFSLILGLSFWPLFLGKFSNVAGFLPLWEMIVVGALGCWINSLGKPKEELFSFGLGFCAGVGFYIWIIAVLPIAILSAFVLWFFVIERFVKPWTVFWFFLPVVVLFIPVAPQIFINVFHGHVADYMVKSEQVQSIVERLKVSLSYLTAPLWGTLDKSYFNFGPLWGGYFNPVLGSLFLLGWIEIYQLRFKSVFWWFVVFFAVCLIPALISNTVEVMRILPIFPFCVFLAALGAQMLIRQFPKKSVIPFLTLCFVFSLGFDTYHLLGPYHQWATPNRNMGGSKSPERFRAFQVLEKLRAEKGTGLVFTDFYYDVFDESLFVTAYDFNSVVNPALDISECGWAAVLIAPWDREVFMRRFPKAVFYNISSGLGVEGNEILLATWNISSSDLSVLKNWVQIHRQLSDIYPFYPFHIKNANYAEVMSRLWNIYKMSTPDPFLKDCLTEKLIDAASQSSDPQDVLSLAGFQISKTRYSNYFDQKCAIVFHKAAVFYAKAGNAKLARKMLLKAAALDSQYPLRRNLDLMNEMIANSIRKKS